MLGQLRDTLLTSRRPATRGDRRLRPVLDGLEARTAPSTLAPSGPPEPADTSGLHGGVAAPAHKHLTLKFAPETTTFKKE